MGNKASKEKMDENEEKEIENMKFPNVINYKAAKYITKANIQDLKNLHNPKYCNKLVILTSKIIKHYLNNIEIDYMIQKMEGNIPVNKMSKESILYLNKDNLDNLDISSHIKKKRMCIGIAKFYIKIAHLFAAIASTINPSYTYKDTNTGQTVTIPLRERTEDNPPKGVPYTSSYNNLCLRRINALRPIQNNENGIIIKSKNCKMNLKENSTIDGVEVPIPSTETKNLADEVGIPELESLYLDEYDYNTGKFIGMTEKSKQNYINDMKKFYKAFTGGKPFPDKSGITIIDINNVSKTQLNNYFKKYGKIIDLDIIENKGYIVFDNEKNRDKALQDSTYNVSKWEINSYSQIPLKDFHNQSLCKDDNSPWLKSYKSKPNDELFVKYGQHLKDMISKSQKIEKSLLHIIKQLFSFWIDKNKKEKILTVNPNLNNELLQKLTEQARESIINLYIGCETDFQKGLSLFETIVKTKNIEKLQRVNSQLNEKMNELLVEKPDNYSQDSKEEKNNIEQNTLVGGKINLRKKRTRKKYN